MEYAGQPDRRRLDPDQSYQEADMKKFITAAAAALALGGAVAGFAQPAAARGGGGGHGGGGGGHMGGAWGGGGHRRRRLGGGGHMGGAWAGGRGGARRPRLVWRPRLARLRRLRRRLGLGRSRLRPGRRRSAATTAGKATIDDYDDYGGCAQAWQWDPYYGRYILTPDC